MSTQNEINIIFLHGTLQRASVWDSIISELQENLPDYPFSTSCPDLYETNPASMKEWIDDIDRSIDPTKNNILIGYSLGGRFALSLYEKDPSKYAGLVLICTDPGLKDDSKKDALIANDQKWAERFTSMPWGTLMSEWAKLPVFANIPNPVPPSERDFDRTKLSRLWLLSSKANNESLWNVIPQISCPSLVLTGSLDKKFDEIAKEISLLNKEHIYYECLENTGHRVPWESRDYFINTISRYLKNIALTAT